MVERRRYAELHAHSAYSFLDGASSPQELVTESVRRGLTALALTDHDGLYGVVQLAQAARGTGLGTVFGSELTIADPSVVAGPRSHDPDPGGQHLVVLVRDAQGYRNLSAAIGRAYLATGQQGQPTYDLETLARAADGHWQILTGCRKGVVRRALEPQPELATPAFDQDAADRQVGDLIELFGRENVAVEITHHGHPRDDVRCEALAHVAARRRVELVATNNVHYAGPAQARRAHVLAAIRAGRDLHSLDGWLPAHGQAYIRSADEMHARLRSHPEAIAAAARIGEECAFDLSLVAPKLPHFPVPGGHTEDSWLRELVITNAPRRYGPREREAIPGAWAQLAHELDIICRLGFAGYFLIVHQIMEMCRERGILAQGRGSAANSAVCYVLGVTAVDAVRHGLLFERFLSDERDGPPDIDVDIESARREEVIQELYRRYGRTHAAQVANVISYRPRSAVRDTARALGYDVGQQDAWSKQIERWGPLRPRDASQDGATERGVPGHWSAQRSSGTRDASERGGMSPEIPEQVIDIADELLRLPRHLSIHSGGMVLCDRPVIEVCPVQWAAMPGRTVLQWDKEDCADAGLVKFDLLGLGMLTALRLMFDHVERHEGIALSLYEIPQEDPLVYDLLCRADTVGIFQVESRAQMSTLPRLRPQNFYDLVVEVALIRPGPIQGGSVHPYINRRRAQREGKLPPDEELYLHPLLKPALERTLGIPLFQEQLMTMAVDAAGFTAGEADTLRRAMGSKRSQERMAALRDRLHAGMAKRGIPEPVRDEIYEKLKAFADFGFPESHAFSFAFLVYASAWLKAHHPAAFYAGLLAAQPMGFYSPQSLVADARRHGVTVLRACVAASAVLATVEPNDDGSDLAVRLGLTQVRGITKSAAERIVRERESAGRFADLADLAGRTALTRQQLENLAAAGALADLGVSRREGLWAAGPAALEGHGILPGVTRAVTMPTLPGMTEVEIAATDAWATGITVDNFPTDFVRDSLTRDGVILCGDTAAAADGTRVAVAGIVTHRQRPATAHGVTFLSLEDESGLLNVVCSEGFWRRFAPVVRRSGALIVRGRVENAQGVVNLIAEHARTLPLRISSKSRDFR